MGSMLSRITSMSSSIVCNRLSYIKSCFTGTASLTATGLRIAWQRKNYNKSMESSPTSCLYHCDTIASVLSFMQP